MTADDVATCWIAGAHRAPLQWERRCRKRNSAQPPRDDSSDFKIVPASSPNFNRPLFALRRSLGYDESNGRTTLGYSTIVQHSGDGPSVGDRHRIDCSALAQ